MTGQTDFTQALLDPGLPIPAGLVDPQGRPAGRRFSVYRNNVAVSLTEALETAFPVVRKLVGDEFFRAMAGIFLRAHPPRSPLLMFYGAEMPGFLENFPPVASLPYLPDVARLELALRHSYHAADATPADAAALLGMAPDRLELVRFCFAPAVQLLRSPWPVHGIWAQNTRGGPAPAMAAQSVLVVRPGHDPEPRLLGAAEAVFVAALMAGDTLGDAAGQAGDTLNLTAALTLLISGGCITQITMETLP